MEPIFESEDIKLKMPLEFKKFESVDKSYRGTMDLINQGSNLWENIDSDRLKNEFDVNNK